MNGLHSAKRVQIVTALAEGSSINATCRMTGVAKHTVLKLLKDVGCAAAAYHNATMPTSALWACVVFRPTKFGRLFTTKIKTSHWIKVQTGMGSVWTWTAIDADTKLIISYTLGDRGAETAKAFMQDVASDQ